VSLCFRGEIYFSILAIFGNFGDFGNRLALWYILFFHVSTVFLTAFKIE